MIFKNSEGEKIYSSKYRTMSKAIIDIAGLEDYLAPIPIKNVCFPSIESVRISREVDFNTCQFQTIEWCRFDECVFTHCIFDRDMFDCIFSNCVFEDCIFMDIELSSTLMLCDFIGCDFKESNLNEIMINGVAFTRCDISKTDFGVMTFLKGNNWGTLPDKLCLELMRHDAEFVGYDKMHEWGNGWRCPYGDNERDFNFRENRQLWQQNHYDRKKHRWKNTKPKLRGLKLLEALCKFKHIKIKDD